MTASAGLRRSTSRGTHDHESHADRGPRHSRRRGKPRQSDRASLGPESYDAIAAGANAIVAKIHEAEEIIEGREEGETQ